jgi:hypothetical protein
LTAFAALWYVAAARTEVNLKRLTAVLCLATLLAPASPAAFAEERVDLDMITRIRAEGYRRSKVMDTASELMDRIGPRLTGSPQMKAANEWTRKQFADWGLANAHLESWGPFGRGWWYEKCAVRMTAPDHAELLALPSAWTPGTNGSVKAAVVHLDVKSKEDLAELKGKFTGKIVLYGDMPKMEDHDKPEIERYDEKKLAEVQKYEAPGAPGRRRYNREEYIKRRELRTAVDKFLAEEKPLAVIDDGRGDLGTFYVQGLGSEWKKSKPLPQYPSLEMESEHFGRIARLLDRDVPVELELDVVTHFIDEDQMQANTIAELPGGDRKDEVVMIGAHLDSWHGGTGATDNGAGSVVVMGGDADPQGGRREASPHDPRRAVVRRGAGTVRIEGVRRAALRVAAAADEGRRGPALVSAAREVAADDQGRAREARGVLQPRQRLRTDPRHLLRGQRRRGADLRGPGSRLSGTLGATTVTMNRTGGTDHQSFDNVGLPGFQFIQDALDYETRTHHSNMDLYERLDKDDLMQASVIMAAFAYNAAMRDGMLPRKPLPTEETAAQSEFSAPPVTPRRGTPTPGPSPTPTPGPH